MTTKQHYLQTDAIDKLSNIADSLKRANCIAILEELYNVGKLGTDEYVTALTTVACREGFILR